MRSSKACILLMLAAIAGLGCDQATTAPDHDSGTAPSASLGSLSRTQERALRDLEELERRRIDAEEERSEATYESLKAIWESEGEQADPSLIQCEPLQYRGEVRIIGPAGGTLNIGPHRLTIPKGALTTYQVITGEMPVSTNVTVRLSPHGLQFARPVQLILDYEHCNRPNSYVHSVVYVNEHGQILEWPSSWDYASYEEVWGTITHFSRYAVASE